RERETSAGEASNFDRGSRARIPVCNSGGRMRARRQFIWMAVAFATSTAAAWAQNDAGSPQADPNSPQPSQQQNTPSPATPNPPAAPEYKEDTPIVVLGASGSLQPFQYGP